MNVQGSVDAIMESGESFGSIFYKTFFDRCPAAAKYFEGNDMSRQSVVLTMTLKLIEQHQSHGFKAIEQYLKHIGTRHKDLSIPQDMYPDWKDALLATLEQFHGDDWNNALATDWSKAVDDTVEIMFRGYEERGSV